MGDAATTGCTESQTLKPVQGDRLRWLRLPRRPPVGGLLAMTTKMNQVQDDSKLLLRDEHLGDAGQGQKVLVGLVGAALGGGIALE